MADGAARLPGRLARRRSAAQRRSRPAQLDFSAKGRSLVVWTKENSIWRLGAVIGLAIIGFFYFLYTLVDQFHAAWKRVAANRLRRKPLKLPAA